MKDGFSHLKWLHRRSLSEIEQEAEQKLFAKGLEHITVHITIENGTSDVTLLGGTDEELRQAKEILGIKDLRSPDECGF